MANISATGYVHSMLDKKMNFQQFALSCARAFGALIEMRDEPMDAEIPEELKPSNYHVEARTKSEQELNRLLKMNKSERGVFGENKKRERVRSLLDSQAVTKAEVDRCREMLAHVTKWAPPEEYADLKEFMVEQLSSSIKGERDDFYARELQQARATTALEWWEQAVDSARRSITYHTEENRKEIERAAERTNWIRGLRAAVAN